MIIPITLSATDPSCLNLTVRACFERFRLNMDTSAIYRLCFGGNECYYLAESVCEHCYDHPGYRLLSTWPEHRFASV